MRNSCIGCGAGYEYLSLALDCVEDDNGNPQRYIAVACSECKSSSLVHESEAIPLILSAHMGEMAQDLATVDMARHNVSWIWEN